MAFRDVTRLRARCPEPARASAEENETCCRSAYPAREAAPARKRVVIPTPAFALAGGNGLWGTAAKHVARDGRAPTTTIGTDETAGEHPSRARSTGELLLFTMTPPRSGGPEQHLRQFDITGHGMVLGEQFDPGQSLL